MSKKSFIRLDQKERRLLVSFLISAVITCAVLSVGFAYFTPSGNTTSREAMNVLYAVYSIVFLLMLIRFLMLQLKGIKKVSVKGTYWRTTEGIFDFNDPQSIADVLVLWRDYSSSNILQNLHTNRTYDNLMFNIFEKVGFVSFDGERLFVYSNNELVRKLCVETLDKSIASAIAINKILLRDFSCLKQNCYVIDNISEETFKERGSIDGKEATVFYVKKLEDATLALTSSLYQKTENFCTTPCLLAYKKNNDAEVFKASVKRIHSVNYVSDNDGIVSGEEACKKKYYKNEHSGSVSAKSFALVTAIFLFSVAIYNALAGNGNWSQTFFLTSIVASFLLGIFANYLCYLSQEVSEKLNDAGREKIEKIQGLKNFICDFTQLGDKDVNVNYLAIWDEFALFAHFFGLLPNLEPIAQKVGIDFDENDLAPYFKENEIANIVLDCNQKLTCDLPYPDQVRDGVWIIRKS